MSSQRETSPSVPTPANVAPVSVAKVSVGQFAERFRGEAIPLSSTFAYFCSSVPMSEELVKEYLEEPVAALPPTIAAMLPKISILLVPYLERSSEGQAKERSGENQGKERASEGQVKAKRARRSGEKVDFVVSERPAEGKQSWASQVSFDNETVLVFALKEQDVAEYHYRFYRRLAALVADHWSADAASSYTAMVRDELSNSVHGEVDDDSWQAKQNLLRRQTNLKRESPLFNEYVRQSFIDTLTLYLHGICCDIDVETGPRQLPSRYLRKRLNLLKSFYPPPSGYAVFPEDSDDKTPLLLQ